MGIIRVISLGLGAAMIALAVAACGEDNPSPSSGDPAILGGFESMPKQIATIALTPTATAVAFVEETTVNVAQPTPTPGRPQPTPTLTPYVGIFLGDITGDGEPAPTLAPYVVNPFGTGGVVSSGSSVIGPASSGTCSFQVASAFVEAYTGHPAVQQALGCPVNGGNSLQLVAQPFERGIMVWRDTSQIYALANNNQFWQIADSWNESLPADDPAFTPPDGLLQPVRGFGLAWRSNQPIRDALGWGVQPETPYGSFWQDFEGGALLVGNNGRVYAVYPAQGQHSGPL